MTALPSSACSEFKLESPGRPCRRAAGVHAAQPRAAIRAAPGAAWSRPVHRPAGSDTDPPVPYPPTRPGAWARQRQLPRSAAESSAKFSGSAPPPATAPKRPRKLSLPARLGPRGAQLPRRNSDFLGRIDFKRCLPEYAAPYVVLLPAGKPAASWSGDQPAFRSTLAVFSKARHRGGLGDCFLLLGSRQVHPGVAVC